ncbi:unnamed protein product [Eruca vesicaria subsp. sativa]|uniref:Uncharacterized protein n=1 Tax=Eruca vesicaria subsp. sativa TaxID=29727 RepID=A0ABC8LHV9_ERUVS|nr:unnamed protein product [Eruca vesicaria subsp. sativa]
MIHKSINQTRNHRWKGKKERNFFVDRGDNRSVSSCELTVCGEKSSEELSSTACESGEEDAEMDTKCREKSWTTSTRAQKLPAGT